VLQQRVYVWSILRIDDENSLHQLIQLIVCMIRRREDAPEHVLGLVERELHHEHLVKDAAESP